MKISVLYSQSFNIDPNGLSASDLNLISWIKRKLLVPPSSKEYTLSTSNAYRSGANKLTWGFIHEKLKLLFHDEDPGFFVEAGALDGEYLSNTLWLEKDKKWTGLLIEPDLVNYSELLKKNRKAWLANVGLSTIPYSQKKVFSSIVTPKENYLGIWHIRGHSYNVEDGYGAMNDKEQFYINYDSIQCIPLQSLLLALDVSVVDFLSLDIQGGEWDVLKYFPWDKIKLRTLVVEYYEKNIPNKVSPDFVRYMEGKGFVLVGLSEEPDYFFVHKNNTSLLNKINIPNNLLNSI
ncbi:UNVERIFIED_CONTAM: hypothetical protein GTU68_025668 [Idotea baltica]|nr:hypothetical protein [Idotea baltica]